MKINLQVPDTKNLTEFDVKMSCAAKLYDDGKIGSGVAAEMVGIPRRDFLRTVGKYGVSIFQYTAEEVKVDCERATARA